MKLQLNNKLRYSLYAVLACVFLLLTSCKYENGVKVNDKSGTRPVTVFEYDGCEYISVYSHSGHFAIAHKGNCKYCNTR